jgi:nitrogen fixation NifU-like protein
MSDALYQDAIMTHARNPQKAGALDAPRRRAVVDNPLCGDRVTVDVRLDGGIVGDLAQSVRGCALCKASASILAAHAVGLDRGQVAEIRQAVARMLADPEAAPPPGDFAEYAVFEPARPMRSRHDCILLPFEAVDQAWEAAETAA